MRLGNLQITAALALAMLIGSCSSLAPKLVGSPDETGFLAIEGEISKSGLFSGGATFSKKVELLGSAEILSPDNQVIKGAPFIRYLIFSNLKPGKYRVLRVGANAFFKPDVEVPDHEGFKFTIEAGKPRYLGRLEVGSFNIGLTGGIVFPGNQKIGLRHTPEYEIRAWKSLSDTYSETPWAARMKARLAELQK